MKKAWMVGLIAMLHVVFIGSLMMQGCGTTRPQPVEQKEAPVVMPPVIEPVAPPVVEPAKVELPPVAVPKKVYTVKSGDSLSYIAQRFNVSTRDIIKMNKISNPNKVKVGTKLTLPGYVDLNAKEPVRKPRKVSTVKKEAPVAAGGEYVVKSGDTLGHIAQRNGTTSKAIKQLNNLTSDSLKIGQKLALPKGGAAPEAAPAGEGAPAGETPAVTTGETPAATVDTAVLEAKPGELLHVVEPNQQLDAIAIMYGVRVEDLIQLNNLTSPDVKVGQTLKIPPPVE